MGTHPGNLTRNLTGQDAPTTERPLRIGWLLTTNKIQSASVRYRCYHMARVLAQSGIDSSYFVDPDALADALPDLDAMIRAAGVDSASPFLFIGILSSQRTFRRRITVTSTWLQFVTHTPTYLVEAKFILTPDEVRPTTSCALSPRHALLAGHACLCAPR